MLSAKSGIWCAIKSSSFSISSSNAFFIWPELWWRKKPRFKRPKCSIVLTRNSYKTEKAAMCEAPNASIVNMIFRTIKIHVQITSSKIKLLFGLLSMSEDKIFCIKI